MSQTDNAVIVIPPPTSSVDLAISAWLHAKTQRSHSAETHRAYETTIVRFRSMLLQKGLDLDACDPQQLQQALDAEDRTISHDRPARVAQLVDANSTTIALVAQGFAAMPTPMAYGPEAPAANTHNLRLAIISSFYAYALRQGLLHGNNPIARVERAKAQPFAQAHGLDQETLVTSIDAIDRDTPTGLRDFALLIVGLYTGRRLSELAAMSREHVTVRRTAIEILWPRCKGGRTMRDTIARAGQQALPAQALLAWLAWLQSQETAVGATTLAPYSPVTVEHPIWISLARNGTAGHRLSLQGIADICKLRIGTSKVHTLRHTFARALEDAGAKVSEIQSRLGHASLDTTSRYLAQLRADENPHLSKLTSIYGLKSHLTTDESAEP